MGLVCQAAEVGLKKGLRRLVLVSLDWARPKDPPLSLGHASILANLQAHKVDVDPKAWAVNASTFNVKEVVTHILDWVTPQTDVGLGAFVWNEPYIQEIIRTLKREKFPGRIIFGGPQISYIRTL